MRSILLVLVWGLMPLIVWGQSILTQDEAISAAMQQHPSVQAAAWAVKAKRHGEKAALNLPNPEINTESPTGEFYTLGVLQSFEFPTVYARQKKVAKAETSLAQSAQKIQENELRFQVRSQYLLAQMADYQWTQWVLRDSIMSALAGASTRQFEVGEIDFLQKNRTESEAAEVHQQCLMVEKNASLQKELLAVWMGSAEIGLLAPLRVESEVSMSESRAELNPQIAYQQQQQYLAEQQVRLAKSKALPNFSLGYLNQGARNTPLDYQFRASVGVPLWAGQYRAGVQAAQAESQSAQANVAAQSQQITLQLAQVDWAIETNLELVRYYEQDALPRSRELLAAAIRMREAGELDYIGLLRMVEAVFDTQDAYFGAVQALKNAENQQLFLLGR